jgi:TatD DNase family protein
MLVDSHCHLTFPDFKDDVEDVLTRAKSSGVQTFLTICCKVDEIAPIQAFSKAHDNIFCTVGIHPHEATPTWEQTPDLKAVLEQALTFEKVVGLGETGLDYYYEHSNREHQERSFRLHCELSLVHDLPLIIHTRDAEADTLRILDDYPGVKGVFHCFSGSQHLAQEALKRGFYLSLSGILTFKTAEDLRQAIAAAPLDRLLVETDAPYLAPIPHRGKRNESAFMVETAKVLAGLKQVSFEEVAKATTDNFFGLFSKAPRLC